ncbi:hypothetical protein SRABI80_03795 [Peribacillus frigoritolerans]|nr:hypothetical protein SRABI80_03795 [Peribacillus frigoritolerans]
MIPPHSAVKNIAFGIVFFGSGVSSDSVVTASNPKKEKQRIVAPVIMAEKSIPSFTKGINVNTSPVPSPSFKPLTTRMMNTAMMAI